MSCNILLTNLLSRRWLSQKYAKKTISQILGTVSLAGIIFAPMRIKWFVFNIVVSLMMFITVSLRCQCLEIVVKFNMSNFPSASVDMMRRVRKLPEAMLV